MLSPEAAATPVLERLREAGIPPAGLELDDTRVHQTGWPSWMKDPSVREPIRATGNRSRGTASGSVLGSKPPLRRTRSSVIVASAADGAPDGAQQSKDRPNDQ